MDIYTELQTTYEKWYLEQAVPLLDTVLKPQTGMGFEVIFITSSKMTIVKTKLSKANGEKYPLHLTAHQTLKLARTASSPPQIQQQMKEWSTPLISQHYDTRYTDFAFKHTYCRDEKNGEYYIIIESANLNLRSGHCAPTMEKFIQDLKIKKTKNLKTLILNTK